MCYWSIEVVASEGLRSPIVIASIGPNFSYSSFYRLHDQLIVSSSFLQWDCNGGIADLVFEFLSVDLQLHIVRKQIFCTLEFVL